jgi:pimeloyl-ACP methyl ester carboxylesterase
MGFDSIGRVKVEQLEVAFREVGEGPPVLLIHGWPLSSRTWRKVAPSLGGSFRCIALDLAGAGETAAPAGRSLGLAAQAQLVAGFVDALGLERVAVVGHDSGGSIARGFVTAHPERVSHLVLADTEVPGHRAPLVVAFQVVSRLPGAGALLSGALRSRALARSPLGFGACFADLRRFDFDEFFGAVIEPGAASPQRREAALRFIRDFDWADVDAVRARYDALRMPKLLLWGERDRFFPVAQGRRLAEMLPEPRRFEVVSGAGLFIHEERPEAWAQLVGEFLRGSG